MTTYYISISATSNYSGSYCVEASSIEEARRIVMRDSEDRFRECDIQFEPTFDPFEDVRPYSIESEDDENDRFEYDLWPDPLSGIIPPSGKLDYDPNPGRGVNLGGGA